MVLHTRDRSPACRKGRGNQYWQGGTLLPAGLMAALSLLALILFVVLRRRTAGCTSYGAAKGS